MQFFQSKKVLIYSDTIEADYNKTKQRMARNIVIR